MPKLDLTNNEFGFLQDLLFFNRIDEDSFLSKELVLARKKGNTDRAKFLNELERNLFEKANNVKLDGFKG